MNTAVITLCALWLGVELLRQALAFGRRGAQLRVANYVLADRRFDDIEVLQAVRSGDAHLAATLGAVLAELGSRGARLHWLLDADDLAAQTAAQQALSAHPQWTAQVRLSLHPPCPERCNPKLFKLDRALPDCRREFVLVLDDDAALPAASLRALRHVVVGVLPGSTATVATALPVYRGVPWPALIRSNAAVGLGAALLARFVNDQAGLTYLASVRGGSALSLNGMCWLIGREALIRIGGFAPQLGHLTDDLAMAEAVRAAGGRIEQRFEPVWLRTDLPDLRAYVRQMHRWLLFAHLLLRRQPPARRLGLLFELGLPQLLPVLVGLGLLLAPSTAGGLLAAAAIGMQLFGRWALQQACTQGAPRAQPVLSLLLLVLVPLHALHAALDARIVWRQHRYRVRASDDFEEIR